MGWKKIEREQEANNGAACSRQNADGDRYSVRAQGKTRTDPAQTQEASQKSRVSTRGAVRLLALKLRIRPAVSTTNNCPQHSLFGFHHHAHYTLARCRETPRRIFGGRWRDHLRTSLFWLGANLSVIVFLGDGGSLTPCIWIPFNLAWTEEEI